MNKINDEGRSNAAHWAIRATEAEDRLAWLERQLFERKWNGVVGSGYRMQWVMTGNHRHTVQRMVGETFAEAIDAAKGAT